MVSPIKCLFDNYAHIVRDAEGGANCVVDPSEYGPVANYLKKNALPLHYILLTHHHWDHVGGVAELKKEFGAKVVGNAKDAHRMPPLDIKVNDNELVRLGSLRALVFDIPGHTVGHVAYYFASEKALFSGDTLFALGCGRLFEGSPKQMFDSLRKLSNLPDDTQLFCGHEYTLNHCRFLQDLAPGDQALKAYCDEQRRRIETHGSTIPSFLGDEKRFNPFVRAESVDAFTEVRKRKDDWN